MHISINFQYFYCLINSYKSLYTFYILVEEFLSANIFTCDLSHSPNLFSCSWSLVSCSVRSISLLPNTIDCILTAVLNYYLYHLVYDILLLLDYSRFKYLLPTLIFFGILWEVFSTSFYILFIFFNYWFCVTR